MSTLLRKVRSTINESSTNLHLSGKLGRRNRLLKPQDRADPALDPSVSQSTATTTDHPLTLTEFRRRLARKASTFSLRTKRRQGELKERDRRGGQQAEEQSHVDELTVVRAKGEERGRSQLEQHPQHDHLTDRLDLNQEPSLVDSSGKGDDISCAGSSVTTVRPATSSDHEPFVEEAPSQTNAAGARAYGSEEYIRKRQAEYISITAEGGKVLAKMASEQVQPPVPYTRLKEITESACETALSGITSYSHTETESWNTTIINNVLGALVEETTPPVSGPGLPQPHFKYVVNSTIIQHASTSSTASDETKKISGRRGMHAASGAFWNNEKDGMWSYKYPGADSKGLDVVIGIIWIWVG